MFITIVIYGSVSVIVISIISVLVFLLFRSKQIESKLKTTIDDKSKKFTNLKTTCDSIKSNPCLHYKCGYSNTGKDTLQILRRGDAGSPSSIIECKSKCKGTAGCVSYDWRHTSGNPFCSLYKSREVDGVYPSIEINVHNDVECELDWNVVKK